MTKAETDNHNEKCLIAYMLSIGIREEDFDTLPF